MSKTEQVLMAAYIYYDPDLLHLQSRLHDYEYDNLYREAQGEDHPLNHLLDGESLFAVELPDSLKEQAVLWAQGGIDGRI